MGRKKYMNFIGPPYLGLIADALGETSDENHHVISLSFDSTVARHTLAYAARFASSAAVGPVTL